MKNLRKRIWIDPFQTGLLVRICIYLLVYQVGTWAFFTLCDLINSVAAERGAAVPYLRHSLTRCFLVLLILTPPMMYDAVRFAHRLVGPLYRFRKTIQAIAAGEQVAPVQLRNGDLLMEFKDDFNAMLKYLEAQGYVLLQSPEAGGEPVLAADAPAVVPSGR